ncbi:MAG: hypothetical protein LBF88_07135 [Planctomycetaceae bacterium]|jgi:hypothetical protein|nr:hypothetical protein [Planctomycetaceae bacterium]
MSTTDRINVTAQLHTTNVFSGHITDELSGDELLTHTNIGRITYQRYRLTRTLTGGYIEMPLDGQQIELPVDEYRLYDLLQTGLQSTNGIPYTFLWLIPEDREPFFTEAGKYYVVFRFFPREESAADTVLKLSFEVTVI